MNDLLYSILNKYFLSLSTLGYVNYNKVYALLFLSMIQELTSTDYDGFLTEDNYMSIQKAIYNIMIVFPEQTELDTIYVDSASRIASETYKLKEVVEDIKSTVVVKTKDTNKIEVQDITL
jgi:hypothetical protein